MSNLGFGVMLGLLGGNKETVDSIKQSFGKTIKALRVSDTTLSIDFTDNTTLLIQDDGQSCCEHRYMKCDDELSYFVGSILQDMELADVTNLQTEEYGDHEVQFLKVTTSKGVFSVANHNEHNGYYGGFWITAKLVNTSPTNI